MQPPLYDQVKQLSCDIVNSSELEDQRSYWESVESLRALCIEHMGSPNDHPLQWEALADFTNDTNASLPYYEKAVALAKKLKLDDYAASALFEIAKIHEEDGNNQLALSFCLKANLYAESTDDLDFRRDISDFLLSKNNGVYFLG